MDVIETAAVVAANAGDRRHGGHFIIRTTSEAEAESVAATIGDSLGVTPEYNAGGHWWTLRDESQTSVVVYYPNHEEAGA